MTIDEFMDVLAEQFEDTEREVFTPETRFKELDDWSSLTALSVIAMADEECGVSISSDVVNNSQTVQELYNHIFA